MSETTDKIDETALSLKKFLADNLIVLIVFVATVGSTGTIITLQGLELKEGQKKDQEIEDNKVGKKTFALEKETINHAIEATSDKVDGLEGRVRRKIDGGINKHDEEIEDLKLQVRTLETEFKNYKEYCGCKR